jgi:hypothetical protein
MRAQAEVASALRVDQTDAQKELEVSAGDDSRC